MENSNKIQNKKIKKSEKEKIDVESEKLNVDQQETNIEDNKDSIQIKASNETKSSEDANQDKYFSDKKFADMGLSEETLNSLTESGFETATEIQEKCIPLASQGVDIIGSAKTGSGKSLAFLIPAVELLAKLEDKESKSTRVLVLTPTRELALQLFNLARDLLRFHEQHSCALIMGGANRKVEAEKLRRGVSLIIATPGRLLDHLANTKGFDYSKISLLVIDEADDILKIGFEKELKEILSLIPKNNRQTMLFSATMSPKVEDIITLSMGNYEYVGIKSKEATVSTLEQGYVVVDPDKKFRFLYSFIRKNLNKKIMVFFSTIKAVEFYSALLNYVDIPCKSIHGDQKQQKRSTTYLEFCGLEKGILLCTDVAQRGLDFPDVDWVIQYDPPHDPQEYLHRVGRTARGANKLGKALLVLIPCEIGMVRYLKSYKISINEFDFDDSKLSNIQEQLEKLVNKKDHFLLTSATDAYRSYLHAYVSHTLKDVYDINNLDLSKLCKAYGLPSPPFVNLNLKILPSSQRRKKLNDSKSKYSKGYGAKSSSDSRQFTF